MSSILRHHELAAHHIELVLVVNHARKIIARHAASALCFLTFCLIWAAIFYLALR
jgi:hypothetical protein